MIFDKLVEDVYRQLQLPTIHKAHAHQVLGLWQSLNSEYLPKCLYSFVEPALFVKSFAQLQKILGRAILSIISTDVVSGDGDHAFVLLLVGVGQRTLGVTVEAGRIIMSDASRSHFAGLVQH